MTTLKCLREEIEEIDANIIKYLGRRKELSIKIGQLKFETGREIIDLSQEERLFDGYENLCKKYDLHFSFIQKLFRLIIDYSRNTQQLLD